VTGTNKLVELFFCDNLVSQNI